MRVLRPGASCGRFSPCFRYTWLVDRSVVVHFFASLVGLPASVGACIDGVVTRMQPVCAKQAPAADGL